MEVFLFPLVNVTLFPATTKPLHIFEAKYIQMVRDSIAQGVPMAIGYVENANLIVPVKVSEKVPFVRELAGFGYPQIIEERVNGSLLIFLKGGGKIKLGEVLKPEQPYIICNSELVIEETDVTPEMHEKLKVLLDMMLRWSMVHIPEESQRDLFIENLVAAPEIIGCFTSYIVRDYDLQQVCFELDDVNKKIEFLSRLIESGEVFTF